MASSPAPRVLAVIPARGGSKGVPRKNIRVVGGKPLLAYTLETALAARHVLDRVLVSTDDAEIAAIARAHGAEVPFLRPAELARDSIPTVPVLQHAVRWAEADEGARYDWVMLLQPTEPFRTVADLEESVRLAAEGGSDSVISVVQVFATHPILMKRIEKGRLLPYTIPEKEGTRRQDYDPPAYMRNGAIYLTRRDVLMERGSIWGDSIKPYVMPPERSVSVDSELDLKLVELMLQERARIAPTAPPDAAGAQRATASLFGDLWHRYDDPLFEESVQLFARRFEANGFDLGWFRGKRCLDAGCGGGRYTIAMARLGARATGCDLSRRGLGDARRRGLRDGAAFAQGSVLGLPFRDAAFDFVCCSGVLHHTPDARRGLRELARVLRPGGKAFLLLYGKGGLRWPTIMAARPHAQAMGYDLVDRAIRLAGLPANKQRTFLDDLFVPLIDFYGWDEVQAMLAEAGFRGAERWTRGKLDHEASVDVQRRELEQLRSVFDAALASPDPVFAAARDAARAAHACADASLKALDEAGRVSASGAISAAERDERVFGQGHHRVLATRGDA